MKRVYLGWMILLCLVSPWVCAQQNTDAKYRKPLADVLKQVEQRYHVAIRYPDSLVNGQMLTYADWRFRTDLDETLDNILTPLDLVAAKTDPGKYKIKAYEYYRTSVPDGKEKLAYLASQYHDEQSWQLRRDSLRKCMFKALQLSPVPPKTNAKPIITNKRKGDGYTIENIGFEILPGVYICGSLYAPATIKGKLPVVLCPDGHFGGQRYRPDCQRRCAELARMGCMAIDYDLFAWNESLLQFNEADHRRPLAMTVQALSSIRILDYMLALPHADTSRVAISGASGGGSQTMLITALDDRIKLSAPVAMLSCYMYGGCPCESGMPVHLCGGGTDNPEIAAMAAPRPQLIVSDGGDWTDHVPQIEYPYLKTIYGYYGAESNVENAHFPGEGHDYGPNKRQALYHFIARHFKLDSSGLLNAAGNFDEHGITIEKTEAMLVFGDKGEKLPADAIHGYDKLETLFSNFQTKDYKIGLIDLMLLKRQKISALPLANELGADGIEIDMGGLGNRPTFDNKLAIDSVREAYLKTAKTLGIEFCSVGLTGFYSQSFCNRAGIDKIMSDCIETMQQMNIKTAFLPMGIQCDLMKDPSVRDSVVARLKRFGKMAETAGVVIGIETSLDANGEVQLLKDIGSPAIKIYFNFENPLTAGRDLYKEMEILGKDRICQIHCTNKDSVWLQNDPQIDLQKVKSILDSWHWKGWLVIERSRDARDPKNVKRNYGANTEYMKQVFQ